MRLISGLVRVILARLIKTTVYLNDGLYMALYIRHLKWFGMCIEGSPVFIAPGARFDGSDYSMIHLGDKIVIADDVYLLVHDFSIARAIHALGRLRGEFSISGEIHIGSNTFVGVGSIILPGSRIGNNVIIGAGSVIRGVVPDNAIVFGNPAQMVGCTTDWAIKKISENPEWEGMIN